MTRVMWSKAPSLLFVFALLISCDGDVKNQRKHLGERGPMTTEERQTKPFDGVVALGATTVTIVKGPTHAVKLSGPANYLKAVSLSTLKKDIGGQPHDILTISLPFGIKPPRVEVEITVADLVYAEVERDSQMQIADFSRESLTLRAGLAGKIELAPSSYGHLDIEVSKAARVLGPEVMAEEALLRAYGASMIVLGQVANSDEEAMAPSSIGYKIRTGVAK
jgi:hypothetical protein